MIELRFDFMQADVTLQMADMDVAYPGRGGPCSRYDARSAEDRALTLVDRACPKCNFKQPRRLPRANWLERKVMPYFGCYPWECPLCRVHFYRKNRLETEAPAPLPAARMGAQPLGR